MDIDELFQNTKTPGSAHDPEAIRLLDKLIDAALELKAHLKDSNRDSDSLGVF